MEEWPLMIECLVQAENAGSAVTSADEFLEPHQQRKLLELSYRLLRAGRESTVRWPCAQGSIWLNLRCKLECSHPSIRVCGQGRGMESSNGNVLRVPSL